MMHDCWRFHLQECMSQKSNCTHLGDCQNDIALPLMEEILHHLTCMKPCTEWEIDRINWCRISCIISITYHHTIHLSNSRLESFLSPFFSSTGTPGQPPEPPEREIGSLHPLAEVLFWLVGQPVGRPSRKPGTSFFVWFRWCGLGTLFGRFGKCCVEWNISINFNQIFETNFKKNSDVSANVQIYLSWLFQKSYHQIPANSLRFMIHDAIFSATDDSPSENDSPNIWHQLTSNLAKAFTIYISCLHHAWKTSCIFFLATLTGLRGFQLMDIFPATAVWGGIALEHVTLNFDKASVVCRRYGFHNFPWESDERGITIVRDELE